MYENQEPQENQEVKPELTVEEKLQQIVIFPHNLLEVADVKVKPILDILGLEVKGKGFYAEPTEENVTIRQELIKLNKIVTETKTTNEQRSNELSEFRNKVTKLEKYLDDNWDDIDEEVRDELCEIFDIEQEVTKTISIMVKGTIEITAPRGYDWDNIEHDLNPCVDVEISNSELESAGYGFSHDETEIEEY
jgi:hypothetical protein